MEMINGVILSLCLCVCFQVSARQNAQSNKDAKRETRTNPIFLRMYNPSLVSYEGFPAAYTKVCAKRLAGESGQKIYARVEAGDSVYLASMGVWNNPDTEEVNEGEIVRIERGSCELDDIGGILAALPPSGGYHDTAPKESLPWLDSPNECVNGECHLVFTSLKDELLLKKLVRDAIERAIAAYGGDASFRAVGCTPKEHKELSDAKYVIVQQELNTYCSQSPKR